MTRLAKLRVAPHVHSTWSHDGSRSLERIITLFRRLRYDAVLLAEHDIDFDGAKWERYRAACAAASTRRLLLVPGMEYSDPDDVVHVPVWGSHEFLGARRPTGALLEDLRERQCYAVLAHPSRHDAASRVQHSWFEVLDGVELFNRKYDGTAPSQPGLRLLESHGNAHAVAGLDYHNNRQIFPVAVTLAANRSGEAIVATLRSGGGEWSVLGLPTTALRRPSVQAGLKAVDGSRRAMLRVARAR